MHKPNGTVLPVLPSELPYARAAVSCLNPLEPGERISIVQGPLKGLTGVVVSLQAEECLAELLEFQGVCARLPIAAISPAAV